MENTGNRKISPSVVRLGWVSLLTDTHLRGGRRPAGGDHVRIFNQREEIKKGS